MLAFRDFWHYNEFMKTQLPSHRNVILDFAKKHYGSLPEYPWESTPDALVLRHADNRKWYALIMSVSKERLGLAGTEEVDVLNIKCDPLLGSSLRTEEGFLPAYHMNHEKWLSILLDGTVDVEKIYPLLEMSFALTESPKKKTAVKKKTVKSKKEKE